MWLHMVFKYVQPPHPTHTLLHCVVDKQSHLLRLRDIHLRITNLCHVFIE